MEPTGSIFITLGTPAVFTVSAELVHMKCGLRSKAQR
jgi:hypothetical protein